LIGRASRTLRHTVAGSAALSLGVVSFEHAVHAARDSAHGFVATHLLLDAALAMPLAIVAVILGRVARTAWARASLTAGALTLGLVPAAGVHAALHARGGHGHAELGGATHALGDALIAFPVALAIAAVLARARLPRRAVLGALGAATVFTALPVSASPPVTPFATPLTVPPTITDPDVTLTAAETQVEVLPGIQTTMWTYNGTFPGPTIRRPSGARTTVTVANQLPATAGSLTMHHHGAHSASEDDGQPATHLIPTGGARTYTYDLMEDGAPERGAFQWYHDHAMDVTGRNVWMGLAGMVILDDPAEEAINQALPSGARDVPLMLADRSFDGDGQLSYPQPLNLDGVLGDVLLVNGKPQPYFEVADVKYRLRLLNASNTRSYDLSLSDGSPMIQVGTESGLLPAPVARTRVLLGPAERAEVIVDFSGKLGETITLRNALGFSQNLSDAMQFRVVADETDGSTIPATLRPVPSVRTGEIATTRTWLFGRDMTNGQWTINGRGFHHDHVDASPKLGSTERWVFVNTTAVDHIVHIHDVDWTIVTRVFPSRFADPLEVLPEASLRESFRLRPNETVVVESRFTDHLGRYVLHCHLLEHEDFSMMAQFQVVA
jgi:FtsP/CotA-like multicopper oxidase with cupredoxin domain